MDRPVTVITGRCTLWITEVNGQPSQKKRLSLSTPMTPGHHENQLHAVMISTQWTMYTCTSAAVSRTVSTRRQTMNGNGREAKKQSNWFTLKRQSLSGAASYTQIIAPTVSQQPKLGVPVWYNRSKLVRGTPANVLNKWTFDKEELTINWKIVYLPTRYNGDRPGPDADFNRARISI